MYTWLNSLSVLKSVKYGYSAGTGCHVHVALCGSHSDVLALASCLCPQLPPGETCCMIHTSVSIYIASNLSSNKFTNVVFGCTQCSAVAGCAVHLAALRACAYLGRLHPGQSSSTRSPKRTLNPMKYFGCFNRTWSL